MIPLPDLEFAQKFPFTKTGKRVIKELGVSFDSLSERTKKSAIERVSLASKKKPYFQKNLSGHRDFLIEEILSWPLAKIYISIIDNYNTTAGFSKGVAESVFSFLEGERGNELKVRLAQETELQFYMEESGFSLTVSDYLAGDAANENMKLVNQEIEKGRVYINSERFSRMLASRVSAQIFLSLPVDVSGVPKEIIKTGLEIAHEIKEKRKIAFAKISGKVRPELFPPCMEKMYADLLQGQNLSHLARFDLTTFLSAVGMQGEEIAKAFSNAPNYDEAITKYQLKKILRGGSSGRGYSSASCSKVKAHGLCNANCNVSHPTSFYRFQLKNSKKEKEGGEKNG